MFYKFWQNLRENKRKYVTNILNLLEKLDIESFNNSRKYTPILNTKQDHCCRPRSKMLSPAAHPITPPSLQKSSLLPPIQIFLAWRPVPILAVSENVLSRFYPPPHPGLKNSSNCHSKFSPVPAMLNFFLIYFYIHLQYV